MKKTQVNDEFIRKRMERQKRIRKRRLIISFYILIFVLLCVGAVLSLTVFFPIEKLKVEGSAIYTQQEILSVADINTGDNLFAISKKTVLSRLKAKLPYVEKIEFERKLPGEFKIKVTDAEEFAVYKIKEEYYTVSEQGWVLKKSSQPSNKIF